MMMPNHPPRHADRAFRRSLPVRLLVLTLLVLLLPLPASLAQSPVANVAVNAPLTLRITILEGDNALNNIRQRTAREPIVQVEDANHKPVAGVAILFTSVRGPNGAGGTFDSFTNYKTVTNAEGKAVGRGFQPNTVTGQFTVNVEATLGTMMAAAVVIHEENTLPAGAGGSSTELASRPAGAVPSSHVVRVLNLIPRWVIVGVVVGGVGVGVAAATRNSSGAVISGGGGTVTAPAAGQTSGRR